MSIEFLELFQLEDFCFEKVQVSDSIFLLWAVNVTVLVILRCAAWKSSSHFRYIGRWCPTSSVIDDILLLFPLDLSDESPPLLSVPPPAADLFLATDAELDVAGGGGVNDDR